MKNIESKEVIEWAKDFLERSDKEITKAELKEQKKYAILIQNPKDKILLSKLLDESSQIHNQKKLARRIKHLIDSYGVPEFFDSADTFLMKLYSMFGYWFDYIAVPIFKKRLRSDTSKVIINEKPSLLVKHLSERAKDNIGQNVNLLGEVVLGDGEADKRYYHYLEALKDPGINYISIKISGIYAQINPFNYEQNKKDLCERLANIYRHSVDYPFVDASGNGHSKFVNLDMEEYKDTELTLDVFKTVLSLPEFKNYTAGIVIQAYLPDAWQFQSELLEFAHKRVSDGGAHLKMRLVKGANLQMESIVSSLKGWENPVLRSKVEVDANYLHILDRALLPENASVLHVGVASHNFFSIGYAYLLSKQNNVEYAVTFEMLEGMANHLPRVMRSLEKQIILYTPVVKDEHFLNAISYLVRRLDENTGVDNFLSYSFNLKYDSKQWAFLQDQFIKAFNIKDSLELKPFRTQDRNLKYENKHKDQDEFHNEPDTNFDLKPNRLWADKIRNKWTNMHDKDLSAYILNKEQIEQILTDAENDKSGWRKTNISERALILNKVADTLADRRGDLIGCMSKVTRKTFGEGDVEVSEAIDFCRYYPFTMKKFHDLGTINIGPKGIVLVVSPWNFPLAIPVGGVAAALSGGNTVILKPATVALGVATEFAQCFWDAGVPKDALQVVCTDNRATLKYLTGSHLIKHTIMTGGTDTAFSLLENNPKCPLSAETGGKNAIIVTSCGDRDHAIQNIVTSAFSNAGQKCSACSLLLLEKDVYIDNEFKTKLIDAVTSMRTGSPWIGSSVVGPMITNKNEKLLHAINNLEDGESWLVKPVFLDEERFILRPCVKWGVKPGSFTFENELFGPLLAVVEIDNLQHGIDLINASEYGLTSGLQSLDESEQLLWKNSIEAGNLYINRGITGAIVNRQPFGGMKRSAFGGGIKAGGRNYVSCFVNITDNSETALEKARKNYIKVYSDEFTVEKDIHNLMGESNTFRYLPLDKVTLRVMPQDNIVDIKMIISAAEICKTPLEISIDKENKLIDALKSSDFVKTETEQEFISGIGNQNRIRTCSAQISDDIYKRAAEKGIHIVNTKPLMEGRIELLNYLKEQSISFEYHRYGSITEIPAI